MPVADAPHILLVDDSDLLLMLVSEELEVHGYRVTTATDGNAALRVAEASCFDAVVCDLHMPDLDGFQVLASMRACGVDAPVIILSGDEDLSAVLEAMRKGAFDYVLKSSDDLSPLVAAVGRAVTHVRVLRENDHLTGALREHIGRLQSEIEAREAAQKELLVARDQALAASRAKSAFLANMSHELRTPLNAIVGYAELVAERAEELDADDIADDITQVSHAGTHLLSLINDILDLAKIEAGRATLHPDVVDVEMLVALVTASVEPLVHRNHNVLTAEITGDQDKLYIDVQKVRQCLINLLGNAAKFTTDGEVHLHVDTSGGRLRVDVRDTGIGISEEQCASVFDSFAQADASTTRKYGGTGLGLAITRELCHLMGGEVRVQSELGVGTVFTLDLPLQAIPVDQEQDGAWAS